MNEKTKRERRREMDKIYAYIRKRRHLEHSTVQSLTPALPNSDSAVSQFAVVVDRSHDLAKQQFKT